MSGIAVPPLDGQNADMVADAVKQNIDRMTGQQRNAVQLKPLPATATLSACITRLNALLARIQG